MALYKQDDILTVNVVAYGMDGEGIAKENGYVFFIPFALVGEEVKVKVLHVNKKNLVFCELKEVLRVSPVRVKPECNRFGRCGGCDMAHIRYDEQLKIKRDNVVALFGKNAGLNVKIDATVPCSTPFGYRNKIQLPFGTVNGEVKMGFFKEGTHKIVSITKCFLHGAWAEKLIGVFTAFANEHKLTAYDDGTKKGLLRHMVARVTDGGTCIVVVTNGERLPFAKDLLKRLDETFGEKYALYNSVKQEHDNVILGKTMFAIKERRLAANVLGVTMEINPYSFLQLNDEIRDKIYGRIVSEVCERGAEGRMVIDAYAGVGALGAILAKNGATVYNVEIVKEATEDGNELVKCNGLESKVTNINGDAAVVVPDLIDKLTAKGAVDPVLILDPPRKGCDERVLTAIAGITTPHTLYYISCNPATLTRDLKTLLTKAPDAYEISYVTPYDMFPNTKHVETLVQLSHKTSGQSYRS